MEDRPVWFAVVSRTKCIHRTFRAYQSLPKFPIVTACGRIMYSGVVLDFIPLDKGDGQCKVCWMGVTR